MESKVTVKKIRKEFRDNHRFPGTSGEFGVTFYTNEYSKYLEKLVVMLSNQLNNRKHK